MPIREPTSAYAAPFPSSWIPSLRTGTKAIGFLHAELASRVDFGGHSAIVGSVPEESVDWGMRCGQVMQQGSEVVHEVPSGFERGRQRPRHPSLNGKLTHDRKGRRDPAGTREDFRFRSCTSVEAPFR